MTKAISFLFYNCSEKQKSLQGKKEGTFMSKKFKEQVTRIQETLKILYNCKSTVNLTIEPGIGLTKVIIDEIENIIIKEVTGVWGQQEHNDFNVKNHYSIINGSAMPTEPLAIPSVEGNSLQWYLIPELEKAKEFLDNNDSLTYTIIVDEFDKLPLMNQIMLMNLIESGQLPDGSKIDLERLWFVLTRMS